MDRIKRPPSVRTTQAILLLFLIPFLFGVLSPLARCLLSSGSKCPSMGILIRVILIFGGVLTISFFTFWGLQRRKGYGKWLGVISLALLLGVLLMGESSRVIYGYILSGGAARRTMPAGYYEHSTDTQWIAGATFTVALHLSLLFLIFRLAFGGSAKRFFQSRKIQESQKHPINSLNPTS